MPNSKNGVKVTIKKKAKSGGMKVAARQRKSSPAHSSPQVPKSIDTAYARALCSPFDPAAYGARVPDLYSAPTQTCHIRRLITLVSDASGTISVIAIPSLYAHAFASEGTFSGSDVSAWTTWSGNVKNNALLLTGVADTKGKLSNARIVSYGARIRNIASMTNVSGRVTAATLPLKDDMIVNVASTLGGTQALNVAITKEQWMAAAGVPYTGAGDASVIAGNLLPNLPKTYSLSSLELAERGLDIVPKVVTPYAFGLRNTGNSVVGNDVGPGVATGAIFAGDDDYLKFGGFESVLFHGNGFPANTACMTLELVYHVEGTPTMGANAGLIADTHNKSTVNISAFYGALDFAAKAASFAMPVISAAAKTLPVM